MTVQNEILNRLITSLKQVGYPSTNADGEITFYGSLLAMIESPETYDSQRKHWKATSTLSSYIQNYYIERILPQVDATKALRSYTIEDFETIINRIKLANPLLTQGVLNDCYYLVSCVYDAGFINELYPRKFIWSSPSNKMIPFYDREEELRKKAFDIDEELTIREWIAKNINPSQPGQAYGFMMMVALGLRNQCSAGADFNSIEDLTFGDVSSFFVFQSINPKTGKVQASGKSDNQTRRIALIHKIKTLLEERKAFLENEINSGRLLLPPDKSLNLLPIACKDHQYLEHCSSKDINAFAKKVFSELNISSLQLQQSILSLIEDDLDSCEHNERLPSAYICRRTWCTSLYGLGLSEDQFEFVMGHKINNPIKDRNYYFQPDIFEDIARKMRYHLDYVYFHGLPNETVDLREQKYYSEKDTPYKEFQIDLKSKDRVLIIIDTAEPVDDLKIWLTGRGSISISATQTNSQITFPRTVNSRRLIAKKIVKKIEEKASKKKD